MITQRGWGESAGLGGPYGLQQLADDVEAILEQLDLSEVALVGHSMGGKVAQIVAGRDAPTLTGLILVAPAPPVPPQHWPVSDTYSPWSPPPNWPQRSPPTRLRLDNDWCPQPRRSIMVTLAMPPPSHMVCRP
jgi:pimeloyl-ACP methyl ester carboxylesterase